MNTPDAPDAEVEEVSYDQDPEFADRDKLFNPDQDLEIREIPDDDDYAEPDPGADPADEDSFVEPVEESSGDPQ
jgi:hypothetical protein